ncbi:MAG: M6 family metalloprotease domain-containing protein [Armatimonadetes bacterium]|nr:M6 family metalloprotease domain-containing protein [Armatimonadota bacterium]
MIYRVPAQSLSRNFITLVMLCALATGFMSNAGYCVPACPQPLKATQPGGKIIAVHLKGDERCHWNEDDSGYLVAKSQKAGGWVYAVAQNGLIEPTSYLVGSINPEMLGISRAEALKLKPIDKEYKDPISSADMSANVITSGTMKNLVVLVNFSDLTIPYSRQQYDDLFNKIGYTYDGAVGSVKDFYHEVSYNALTVDSVVVEPVTLDYGYAYYGGNDSGGNDRRPREMVQHALAKLAATGFNFQQVDSDGDGWVDGLTIIHAGGGEEYSGNDEDYIWSHKWQLPSTVTYNGVKMREYHTEPARRGFDSSPSSQGITRIGVICHEHGHFLGLPDLYDTTYASKGAGDFCLMAGGSWGGNYGHRPTHMSAWCKVELGWVTPTLVSPSGTQSISTVATNPQVYKAETACGSKQYFLIENRQGVGFDASVPGSLRGLLIWHIDDNKSDNDNKTHYMVDLEEASCTQHLELPTDVNNNKGDDADYFRAGNATSFNSTTCPDSKCYSGAVSNVNITNISATGSVMTFDSSTGSPATITTHPANATAYPGQIVKFSVAAVETGLSYQWQRSINGGLTYANVTSGTGATSNTYATAHTLVSENGYKYRCVVSVNNGPPTNSNAATLTVKDWYTLLYEDFEDSWGDGAPSNWTYTFESGDTKWARNSGDQRNNGAEIGNYNALLYHSGFSDHETYLVTPKIQFASAVAPAVLEFYHKQPAWGNDQDTLHVYYKTSLAQPWTLLESYTSDVQEWTKRSITLPDPSNDYYIAFLGTARYGRGVCIDEAGVWQDKCDLVDITSHPASVHICPASAASFSITTSPAASHYQWQKLPVGASEWVNAGSNKNNFSFITSPNDNGLKVRCLVTNTCGTVASNEATITFKAATSIITQPVNQTVYAGDTAVFSVVATGEGTLSYTWMTKSAQQQYWTTLPNTTSTLNYTATAADNGRLFQCRVSSGCGYASSIQVTLTVNVELSIPEVKLLADQEPVELLAKAVTYLTNQYFYIEEDSRISGIRVDYASHGLMIGDRADVIGVMSTNANGERFVDASSVIKNGGGVIYPLLMVGSSVGGQDWYFDAISGAGQMGFLHTTGLNNVGLLVKVAGKVVSRDTGAGTICIDDGSGSAAESCLTVLISPMMGLPDEGDMVAVTGVSSVATFDVRKRVILARDVQVIPQSEPE